VFADVRIWSGSAVIGAIATAAGAVRALSPKRRHRERAFENKSRKGTGAPPRDEFHHVPTETPMG
jgi:hypothetical protein